MNQPFKADRAAEKKKGHVQRARHYDDDGDGHDDDDDDDTVYLCALLLER